MADVHTINANGVDYAIEDQTARTDNETNAANIEQNAKDIAALQEEVSALNQSLTDIDFFGYGTQIPNNSDLNDYFDVGKYYCSSTSGASTISNTPASSAFSLYVSNLAGSATARVQIFVRSATLSSVIYYRTYSLGAWQSWYCVTGTV